MEKIGLTLDDNGETVEAVVTENRTQSVELFLSCGHKVKKRLTHDQFGFVSCSLNSPLKGLKIHCYECDCKKLLDNLDLMLYM